MRDLTAIPRPLNFEITAVAMTDPHPDEEWYCPQCEFITQAVEHLHEGWKHFGGRELSADELRRLGESLRTFFTAMGPLK